MPFPAISVLHAGIGFLIIPQWERRSPADLASALTLLIPSMLKKVVAPKTAPASMVLSCRFHLTIQPAQAEGWRRKEKKSKKRDFVRVILLIGTHWIYNHIATHRTAPKV
jgi:hypothetical protein